MNLAKKLLCTLLVMCMLAVALPMDGITPQAQAFVNDNTTS